VRSFIEVGQVIQTYGMAELTGLAPLCSAGRYHIQPWVIPFVLDPETSKLLPRQGVQTGRFAFFDLATNSHWGGHRRRDHARLRRAMRVRRNHPALQLERGESACRPGSVRPLARAGGHPSRTAVAGSLVRSTREHRAGSPQTLAQADCLSRRPF
jgi:hypothetical protein